MLEQHLGDIVGVGWVGDRVFAYDGLAGSPTQLFRLCCRGLPQITWKYANCLREAANERAYKT